MTDPPREQPPAKEPGNPPAPAACAEPEFVSPYPPDPPEPAAAIPHPAHPSHSSVQRKPPAPNPDDRRDFFSEAMRETLGPLAGILERRINPFLAALEAIPVEVERLTNVSLPAILDQPQNKPRVALPIASSPAPRQLLRPPGAAAPGEFETLCSRCGKCVEACPAHAIQLDERMLLADGFPFISPLEQPCVVCNELACMPACPTGAPRMVDRFQIKMGTAKVDYDLCLRTNGENCTHCVDVCPITKEGTSPHGDAIVIHEQSGRIRVRKNICTGCGLCESRCPTYPQAIRVIPYAPPHDPIIA